MSSSKVAHQAMALDRCRRATCTGRDYALSPANAQTPGP
jgi:hypothetical protein